MIHLILSLDYELFGNGAGDVRRDMIEPTERILAICERHGAKLTIMFEVAEYWAFQRAEEDGTLELDYSPAKAMRKQAQDALARGHDVQLHLHPQWIGARRHAGGKVAYWQLKFERSRLADLPGGLGDKNDLLSITGALCQGKSTLQEMLRPVDPDYRCTAFRAGGFYAQPSSNVIAGMREAGLIVDSSVVKGLHLKHPRTLDYRNAPAGHGYWWTTGEDLAQRGDEASGVIEMPVHSRMRPYFWNFKWTKLRTTLKRRRIENDGSHRSLPAEERSTPRLATVLKGLFSYHAMNTDFCKLSSSDMWDSVQRVMSGPKDEDQVVPLVMIGHCKDFWNDKHLDAFLDRVKSCPRFGKDVTFGSMSSALRQIQESREVKTTAGLPNAEAA